MSTVTIVGTQWGDEGKGKIVDFLSEEADIIIRFQGGHNAGHTLVVGNTTYKLHMLPSGVVRPGKLSVIGNGVVLDPWALVGEIETLKGQGVDITPDNLAIAENAPLILPIHGELDRAFEAARGTAKIGTTGRGIGPAYEDKVGRRALRACDLLNIDSLPQKLEKAALYHNALRKGLDLAPIDIEALVKKLAEVAKVLAPFVQNTWKLLNVAEAEGKKLLFEGAQGIMLDIDHGTYPFVTSSNIVAGQAAAGSGMGAQHINKTLGITKAYTTRVGSGPFPTELDDETGERLGTAGHEFGTTTGRKRRCGWFDAVQVKQAVMTGGVTDLVITKLDVLDGFDEINICTAYDINGKTYDYLPADSALQDRAKPVYETVSGWSGTTQGSRDFDSLPAEAHAYLKRLSELLGCPIAIVSTSPERQDTIRVKDIFDTNGATSVAA